MHPHPDVQTTPCSIPSAYLHRRPFRRSRIPAHATASPRYRVKRRPLAAARGSLPFPFAADFLATFCQHLARRLERNRRGTPGRGCGFCTTARLTTGSTAASGPQGPAPFPPSLAESSHSFSRPALARFTLPFDFVGRLRITREPMQSPKRRTDLRGNEGWISAHYGVITPALRNP